MKIAASMLVLLVFCCPLHAQENLFATDGDEAPPAEEVVDVPPQKEFAWGMVAIQLKDWQPMDESLRERYAVPFSGIDERVVRALATDASASPFIQTEIKRERDAGGRGLILKDCVTRTYVGRGVVQFSMIAPVTNAELRSLLIALIRYEDDSFRINATDARTSRLSFSFSDAPRQSVVIAPPILIRRID